LFILPGIVKQFDIHGTRYYDISMQPIENHSMSIYTDFIDEERVKNYEVII